MVNKEVRKFLENLPEKFNILEEGIDFQTQKEYIEYSHTFDRGELTESETLNLSNFLYDIQIATEAKKKVLTILAHLGTITAFRQIQEYYKYPGNDIKQWTALALQECIMFLENEFTDQITGFISSGLGGLNNRLRFYFLVLPLADKSFQSTHKNIIKEEFNLIAKDLNSILETVNQSDKFVGLTALVPMDIAIGTLIESGIKKCNELGEFVLEHYYVTNQNIPDDLEIQTIIKKVNE